MRTTLQTTILLTFFILVIGCSQKEEVPVLWETYNPPIPGIYFIEGMAVDSKNNKWFATTVGLVKYDDKTWRLFNKDTGAPCDTLWAMTIDKNDNIYCITSRRTIVKYDGKQWTTISNINFVNPSGIYFPTALCTDSENNLWVAAYLGVYRFDGNIWKAFQAPSFSYTNWWGIDMVADSHNNIWIASERNGLVKFDGTKWTVFSVDEGLPVGTYRSVNVDQFDHVWVGGLIQGVFRLNDSGFSQFKKDSVHSLYNMTRCMAFDSKGNAWFGSEKGVVKYNGKIWTTFLDMEYDQDPRHEAPVKNLVIDKNDAVWTTAYGQIYKILNR